MGMVVDAIKGKPNLDPNDRSRQVQMDEANAYRAMGIGGFAPPGSYKGPGAVAPAAPAPAPPPPAPPPPPPVAALPAPPPPPAPPAPTQGNAAAPAIAKAADAELVRPSARAETILTTPSGITEGQGLGKLKTVRGARGQGQTLLSSESAQTLLG